MRTLASLDWRCHAFAFFVCGTVVGPISYLAMDREIPFQITSGIMKPPNPRPGGTVEIEWTGRRLRDCPGKVIRLIVDSHGTHHTVMSADAQYTNTVDPQPVIRSFPLPVAIAPGPATYYATTYFVCNFTQRHWPIVASRPPVHFVVDQSGPPTP